MQQLQFKFFFPLTEQNELDLDFTPSIQYQEDKRKEQMKYSVISTAGITSGMCLTAGNVHAPWATIDPTYQHFKVLPDGAVGSWQVTPNMSVGRKTKPKLLHRIFTKLILGWEWKDK